MLATRVAKFAAISVLALTALGISAASAEFSGNVADGAVTVPVDHPGALPTLPPTVHTDDVTWGS
ncbi:hypothetical protein AB0K51_25755 [Kitasatospora sp. NPDC049285]|uniref:hypothetical protein n=1 Tax=Kitasatospora sp. NPDC049285 TaxID=3157096 RepID=UPI00343680CA